MEAIALQLRGNEDFNVEDKWSELIKQLKWSSHKESRNKLTMQ
jgi:hypothetical protein